MAGFSPVYPRTISGFDRRSPLEHPELEMIALRMDRLYRDFGLAGTHRGEMLARYALLIEADKALAVLGRVIASITLRDDPGIRPARPAMLGKASTAEVRDFAIGFSLRLAGWIEQLENFYGVTLWQQLGTIEHAGDDAASAVPRPAGGGNNVPRLVRDDDDETPQPGDDI